MRARTTLMLVLSLGLVATVVPAATADHVDDEGDRVTVDFVTGSLDGDHPFSEDSFAFLDQNPEYCTGSATTIPTPGEETHLVRPTVAGGLCEAVAPHAEYELTVQDEQGSPVGFWWHLDAVYAPCQDRGLEYITDGTVTFTTTPRCDGFTSVFDQDALRGTVTLERIG